MTLQKKLDDAVAYLKNLDLAGLEPGKYQVNDDFYYSIQEYETKKIEFIVIIFCGVGVKNGYSYLFY